MLGHALRRLLWSIPALIGISIITFFFLSYVPDPTDDPVIAATLAPAELTRQRRERFRDLPRFFNLAPRGVRERAGALVDAIAKGGPDAAMARTELSRLGGAALPHVLPRLDSLPPAPRRELALALAPIARRMGNTSSEVDDPDRAAAYWTRFWDDRGIEFRRASVRSAVARLVRYGSTSRAADLHELDTFVLDDVLGALEPPRDAASVTRARALVDVAAHVTGRDDRISPGDGVAAARACVERWQAYWLVYRSDFVTDAGLSRVAGMALETRYGKWAYEAVIHRFGKSAAGTPVLDEIESRVPITLFIVFGAIALAYAIAVPLGALGAMRRGHRVDVVLLLVILALYATPTAVIAVLARRLVGGEAIAAMLILAPALLAAPTAQQRSALVLAMSQDHVRAAVARGSTWRRAVLVHGLRNALLPVATLATLEGPMALGGAFVVERVLSLRGIGELTMLAVQERDIAWLMAISMSAALIAAVFVVAADLAYVVIDPRLAGAVLGRRGRA
ncbi:Oligopeptide transport system permease protein OppB [Minicystis rosea]|nr:Oligopeptide transport system permease protein OppB [Minicystis rosea]